MTALDGLNRIVDEKFLSTYGLDDAIKNRVEGDKLDAAVKRFDAADKAWEQQHQSLASTLEIVVDSQFGIDDLAATAKARNADCTRYTLDGLRAECGGPVAGAGGARGRLHLPDEAEAEHRGGAARTRRQRRRLAGRRRRAGPRPDGARATCGACRTCCNA